MVKQGGSRGLTFMRWEKGRVIDDFGEKFRCAAGWVICSTSALFLDYKPFPKRWKPRNNETVRVFCDASAFVRRLASWDKPASSFLEWSLEKNP